MRATLIIAGLLMFGLGVFVLMTIHDKSTALGFFKGAATLGGAWLICAAYTCQSYWHGIIGGTVVALLAACRSWWNLPNWLKTLLPNAGASTIVTFEVTTAILSSVILVVAVKNLLVEKARRQRDG